MGEVCELIHQNPTMSLMAEALQACVFRPCAAGHSSAAHVAFESCDLQSFCQLRRVDSDVLKALFVTMRLIEGLVSPPRG